MELKCDNCAGTFSMEKELNHVFPDIPDLLDRVEPGGVVPGGECPHCGALVYPNREEPAPILRAGRVVIAVRGGVAEVVSCQADVIVEIRDYDTEGCDSSRLAEDGSMVSVVTGPIPDWIDEFAAGAEGELVNDGFTEAEALAIASAAADIIREHEAKAQTEGR